ncbi:DUF916 and DUF3324 domain-containing protein [Metaclostridioides mangenotii]|uniref:DUF916 and DUF3324 domain-containing protein n=1 Tax=Metaclostridioides mangenotii TaxID=1540 RepID=UPI0004853CEB|nr:DUF916 and DUF3324 domain-containing protein [Clostridioides mangenotii]
MKKKLTSIITSVLVVFMMFTSTSYSAELNFSVHTVIPENQIDKSKTYYNLLVKPNNKQVLKMVLKNTTDKDRVINVSINSATTNTNGVIDYGENNIKNDPTLKYDMSEIVSVPSEITVPKHGEYTLEMNVKTPIEFFDGVLAGGIQLQEKETEANKDKKSMITNKYNYVVGILLFENIDQVIDPDLKLHKVIPTQDNARNVISSNLQNIMPTFVKNMSVHTKVYKKDDKNKNVKYSSDSEDMQMAPNSNFNYLTRLEGKKLKPGVYILNLVATSEKNKWEFNEEFVIKGDVANKLNSSDVSIDDSFNWIYILVGVLVFVIILLIGLLIILLKKKKKMSDL